MQFGVKSPAATIWKALSKSIITKNLIVADGKGFAGKASRQDDGAGHHCRKCEDNPGNYRPPTNKSSYDPNDCYTNYILD